MMDCNYWLVIQVNKDGTEVGIAADSYEEAVESRDDLLARNFPCVADAYITRANDYHKW